MKVILSRCIPDADYGSFRLEAGASGYLLKRSAVDELEQAIRAVWAGHTYITPLIAKDLTRCVAHRKVRDRRHRKNAHLSPA